ncbi:MAG: sigma factor-like helix-turn-helix DNA-binding protein [Minisyncoccota bacterium]
MYIKIVIGAKKVEVVVLGDESEEDPAFLFEQTRLPHDLALALAEIGERERQIVIMRFGLNGQTPMTLNDIGKKMKISREHVRRIEERAVIRLRRWASKLGLVEFGRRPDITR